MSPVDPVIHSRLITFSDELPGRGRRCVAPRRELARFEWRTHDGGNPSVLVEQFLAEYALPVRDLSATRPAAATHDSELVCGASLLIGAAAAAGLAGGEAGRPTAVPAVPEVVAVVYAHDAQAPHPGEPAGAWWLGDWHDSWSPAQYADAVEAVRRAIARGDVYQVNLVGHASAPYRGDPGPALRRVARLAQARYSGLLAGAGWALACASPETLVEVRDGVAVTRPIKGTRPATVEGRAELLRSEKERAEHVMIVDLERNDLATVAVTGSVRVDELYAVRRWLGLWHAESVVSARLLPGVGLAALLRALCPGGSVTGAPKLAALAQLAALEPVGRGPSMGAFGWVDHTGVDLGLTIRTVAADARQVHVWAGGGVTWDSDPVAEVAEAAAKAGPLRAALAGDPLRSG
jgi:para-aminobenzoate synthetase component I